MTTEGTWRADFIPPKRFGASSLHQRDSRSALFEGYNDSSSSPRRPGVGSASPSPNPYSSYGYNAGSSSGSLGAPSGSDRPASGGYRSATPNKRGQYSDAVLNELESQNDAQVAGILGKVRVLKDVSCPPLPSLPPFPPRPLSPSLRL